MSTLKYIAISALSLLAPIYVIMGVVGFLIFTDLILGIIAANKRGELITSFAMRRTVSKLLVYQLVLISGFLCETYLLGGIIPITKLAGSVIGLVEIKSILENANDISGEPLFQKILKALGSDNDKTK